MDPYPVPAMFPVMDPFDPQLNMQRENEMMQMSGFRLGSEMSVK